MACRENKNICFQNNRGVALILTIMAISIIVALSVQFNRKMRDQLISTTTTVDHGLKALYVANSGLAYALALLAVDDAKYDTFMDPWSSDNDTPVPKQVSADSQSLFSSGAFSLKIDDLSSKIPLNLLVDRDDLGKVFKRLLENEAFGLEADRVNEIVDSVKDWIDRSGEEDDLTRASGAENEYYMSLENPYHCKNGALDSLEELLLVKGITQELFGTEDAEDKKDPGEEEVAEGLTIRQYLTVYGDDDAKININTASPTVLQALDDDMTQGMADDMVAYRKETDPLLLEQTTWANEAGVPKDIYDRIKDRITTKSTYFRITSTGRYGDGSSSLEDKNGFIKRTVVVVVKRRNDEKSGKVIFDMLSRQID